MPDDREGAAVERSGGPVDLPPDTPSSAGRHPGRRRQHHGRHPVVAVVGATASGKTRLSLDLAERLGGEVVNTDAMQVYRGMDIGTAKLPVGRAPRHPAPPPRRCSTCTRAGHRGGVPALAATSIADSAARGGCRSWSAARRSTPARSSTASSSPAPTRRCARGWRRELGRGRRRALHARLAERDPAAAARILPEQRPPRRPRPRGRRDHRPAVHGQPARAGVRRPAHGPGRRRHRPRDPRPAHRGAGGRDVRRRASSTEVRHLLDHGLPRGRTAPRAIGYREVLAHLAASSPRPRRGSGPRTRRGVRPPAGLLVPQGPPRRLGPLRRPRPRRAGPGRGSRPAEPWRRDAETHPL